MYTITIAQYPSTSLASPLPDPKPTASYTLGTVIQDLSTIQLVHEHKNSITSPTPSSQEKCPDFDQTLQNLNLPPPSPNATRITFTHPTSLFHANALLSAPVVEYVQMFFPSSQLTPSFRAKIAADLAHFDELCKPAMRGDMGLATAWGDEEIEYPDFEGGKARCLFVLRGWESMKAFEDLVGTDAYKDAVGILLAWDAPFKMWHAEKGIKEMGRE